MARDHFLNMFESKHFFHKRSHIFNISNSSSLLDSHDLDFPPFVEIKYSLFQMDPLKAPGPHGIQPIFFQKHWKELGKSIHDFCTMCFNNQ